jgi:hypothetical protein
MDGKDFFDDYGKYYPDEDAPIYDPNDICDFREEQEEEEYDTTDDLGRPVHVYVDRFGEYHESIDFNSEAHERLYRKTGKQFCAECRSGAELKYIQINPKRKSKFYDYWECPHCHFTVSAEEVANGDYNFPTPESVDDEWNEYFNRYL